MKHEVKVLPSGLSEQKKDLSAVLMVSNSGTICIL